MENDELFKELEIDKIEEKKEQLGPSRFSIIPTLVLESTELSSHSKLVYALITSLSRKSGYCYAGNHYLAIKLSISVASFKRSITELIEKGYLEREFHDPLGKQGRMLYPITDFKRNGLDHGRATPSSRVSHPQLTGEPHNKISNNIEVIDKIYMYFQKKIRKGSKLTAESKRKILKRLETYTPKELCVAIFNFSRDAWQMENNARRGVAWFFHTDDRVDRYINMKPRSAKSEEFHETIIIGSKKKTNV